MGVLEKFFEELFGARPPPAGPPPAPTPPAACCHPPNRSPTGRTDPRGPRRRCQNRPRQGPQAGRGGFEAVAAQPTTEPKDREPPRRCQQPPRNPV